MDPTKLHRAVDDVDLLIKMLDRAVFDWESFAKAATSPKVIVKAVVPNPKNDNGVGKDKAKSLGFRWQEIDGLKFPYTWCKRVRESDIANLQAQLGYPLEVLQNAQ